MSPKQRVGEACLGHLRSGMVVGLGTGSTAEFFLQALASAIRSGQLADIRGVPTSRRSEQRAIHLGIPLTTLAEVNVIDLTIDGADEIAPGLALIKGQGGALLREKIVAQNSRRMICIADASKESPVLGMNSPLPVEVTQFGHEATARFLRSLGCEPLLRRTTDGSVFVTDNGNFIYDCRFGGIADPEALQAKLQNRAGIVETGLFLGIASLALIADESGVRERTS
ncbi:MAG: ribose-5-phosphate isomerase RpiA [Phycisphaerae bacterium]|nr:ribose-5-phosphate isomerase RpiA [Phycisphaerae bacterium]MDW8262848.1 ribose-5-phosphate isomerase RpiA [Phycisphaerales bacterium]